MAAIPSGPIRPPLRPTEALHAVPAHPLTGDFVSDYADYADVLEAPSEVHEAVAIALLAAVLNPRVKIEHGALSLTRSWTRADKGGPALYQDFAQNPTGLFIWPEMSQVLKTLKQSQFIGAKEWLTDRYDNPRVPDAVVYRATGQPTNTPPITFSRAPRLNILATSSMEWFVANLEPEDTTGGFLPRWFIVNVTDLSRVIPKPRKPDPQLIKPLADHLDETSKLTGVADLSGVEELYADWYRQAHDRFLHQPNRALAMPFFNRLRSLVLKLAVIFEVSASCSLSVSAGPMQRALQRADSIEQTVFQLLPTGMTAEGFAVDKIEQRIRQAGAPGLTQSELTRAFQDGGKHRDKVERLKSLVLGGRVFLYQRAQTGGRPAGIFVHCEFAAQHEKAFPSDTLK
jgi:hypothetical protein